MLIRTFLTVLLALGSAKTVGAVSLDFESLTDLELVGDSYATDGVHFEDAIALTAGLSLNEIDFPPSSGIVAIADAGSPMVLTFDFSVENLAGNFTFSTALTFTAYSDVGRTSAIGAFTTASSSNLGSTERIALSFEGVRALEIAGDPSGLSFILDDLEFEEVGPAPIPEPSSLFLLGAGGLLVAACVLKRPPI